MADVCQNNGDGDLYGIGVRIGLYLQCAAGVLLRNHHSSWQTISAVRVTNNVLGISIMIALTANTSRGVTLVTDFLLTYYLTIVLFYAESYNLLHKLESAPGGDSSKKRIYLLQPDVPLLLQNFLFAAASLFGGWFWIRGVLSAPQLECGPAKAAVLVSFDLYSSRWKSFAATMSIFVGVIFAFFFFGHLYIFYTGQVGSEPLVLVAAVLRKTSGPPLVGTHPWRSTSRILGLLLRPSWYGRKSFTLVALIQDLSCIFHLFIINLAGPIIAISSVETMIRVNHILTDGIFESTGQMIALIAGISSLCLAVWEILSNWKEPKEPGKGMLARMRHGSARPIGDEELRMFQQYLTRRQAEIDDRPQPLSD